MDWSSVIKYGLAGTLAVGLIYGSCTYIYNCGYDSGVNYQIKKNQEQINNVLRETHLKENQYRNEVEKINLELQKTKDYYISYINNLSGSYNNELQSYKKRLSIYQRSSSAGTAQCKSLGSYAAKLDRSIIEGRQVVKELRGTIIQRDNQIRQLANYINSSRKLYE